jgi:hypothetical protein
MRKSLLCFVVNLLAATLAQAQHAADVLVYGGTPSGITAANAAAREGATVILLEPGQRIGGMVTGGLGATDFGSPRTIGGDTRAFFMALGKHYGLTTPAWKHEPHVAEREFRRSLEAAKVTVHYSARLREKSGVQVKDAKLVSLTTETGDTYTAKVFIDASYEGDLMAQAGVTFTVGREAVATYNEERAGIRPPVPFGHPAKPGDLGSARDASGLIPFLVEPFGKPGDADHRIMSYTFRLCLTRNPTNRVLFTKPHDYDPRRYELVLRELALKPEAEFGDYVRLNEIPNGKVDANNRPVVIVSTNLPNGSWGWPNGTYAQREQIWKQHESYLRGFYWFMQSDPRVPDKIRDEAKEWGLAADEFTDTANWPAQIYVRVARRMIGQHVMTAHDLTTQPFKPDSIGMGSYFMDSHRVSRLVLPNGDVATEGGVGGRTAPYQIAYRSITPKRNECQNLLVPVCLSTSAVALCSIRMEPVYMILGQSAGTAAALAAASNIPVQDLPYSELEPKLLAAGQVLSVPGVKPITPDPDPAAKAPTLPEPDPILGATPPAPGALPGMKGQPEESTTAPGFFPAFDSFGQYMHRTWPGKVTSVADLKAAAVAEESDLQQHPGPADWNQYGGWLAGPQLPATGFFRTAKHDGRWWLVDPDGRLFFSVGVNCVRKMDPTPIEGREHFFADYPGNQPDYAPFVVTTTPAIKGALGGTTPRSFVFAWSNLYRKIGPDWETRGSEIAHRRLRSWGFNTIGNWSLDSTTLMRKTPYVINLPVTAPTLKLSNGNVKDPYDPAFHAAVVAALANEVGRTNGDPWCIGYFVDNEVSWSKPGSVGEATLKAPATQPAKQQLVKDLQARYTTIDALNTSWRTNYASFDALLASTSVPEQAAEDLAAFHLKFADAYYRTVKQGFVESGTKHLYLGSRIHGRQDAICAIAAKYCDVVSVNAYRKNVDEYIDNGTPLMVTEFSFGATDRGMFYGGLVSMKTQTERAAALAAYAKSVRKHPNFVGYHWFQYQDQPASGRTREGENAEYGLVDIADNPATELINTARHIATHIYTGFPTR